MDGVATGFRFPGIVQACAFGCAGNCLDFLGHYLTCPNLSSAFTLIIKNALILRLFWGRQRATMTFTLNEMSDFELIAAILINDAFHHAYIHIRCQCDLSAPFALDYRLRFNRDLIHSRFRDVATRTRDLGMIVDDLCKLDSYSFEC